MNTTVKKAATKGDDFLSTVARSIGSTLGAVAAKVNGSPRSARRRPATRKRARAQNSASRNRRRATAAISRKASKRAGSKRRNS
jgi:hypothetical protein